jgi:hypothetical protein
MIEPWSNLIWSQFGAAIDMLENAITACPESLWGDRSRRTQYWYSVYHTLFFLDLYLDGVLEGFRPPAPFNLDELDPSGVLPPTVYPQAEMLSYLAHCRQKCRIKLSELTAEQVTARTRIPWQKMTYGELLLDNIRHVQHHTAQLNLLLRQEIDDAPRWITKVKDPL